MPRWQVLCNKPSLFAILSDRQSFILRSDVISIPTCNISFIGLRKKNPYGCAMRSPWALGGYSSSVVDIHIQDSTDWAGRLCLVSTNFNPLVSCFAVMFNWTLGRFEKYGPHQPMDSSSLKAFSLCFFQLHLIIKYKNHCKLDDLVCPFAHDLRGNAQHLFQPFVWITFSPDSSIVNISQKPYAQRLHIQPRPRSNFGKHSSWLPEMRKTIMANKNVAVCCKKWQKQLHQCRANTSRSMPLPPCFLFFRKVRLVGVWGERKASVGQSRD